MWRPRRSVSGQFSVGAILNVLNGITLFLSRPLFVVFKQTSEMSYSPTVQLLTSKTRRIDIFWSKIALFHFYTAVSLVLVLTRDR